MQRRHFLASATALTLPTAFGTSFAQAPTTPPGNALIIGCSAALTGPLGDLGKGIQRGVNAAFAEVNEKGGINGRPLFYSLIDDAYKAESSVDNVKQLLSNSKVMALMGCMGTPNNTAFTPLIEASDIVHLGPLTGAASLRKPSIKNVFHVRASYTDEVKRLVDNLVSMNLRDLTIAYLDNGFGKELLQVSLDALSEKGIKALAQVAVATDGKNVDSAVSEILASKPSALLLFTAGNVSGVLTAAARKVSPGLPIAGLSVTYTAASITQLGDTASGIALTMILPDAMSAKHVIVRRYQKAMRALDQTEFDPGSLEGYVNAQLMIEALTKAGANPSRSKIRDAIGDIRNLDLGGFRVDFSSPSTHVGSNYVNLGVLSRNGRFIG
ncbi:ABC transporter substrate-binding protein [Hydrogenophaga crassostreae]|uniref:ABC transporter substrate-binding protein n=1 Tax=Hydrogenophaga crassostreae TaxID=1763535 RepID=A0A167H3J1_9BURK|nr:ABC transporter substrate-binding protein [Hydrogenophaga crassostreae]AOW13021.1 ABC transporter substrate-binding protein [Hydrogenophaga crassostreae]OAD40205.1 ABC transporter substrate-binding protein [Hydrogenophaga crassostreae]